LDLVKDYRMILKEYDSILNLSRQILKEIKDGMADETLVPLLEKKQKIADNINRLAQRIAQTDIFKGAPAPRPGKVNTGQTLAQVKSLLEQIRSRAKSLLRTEKEIESILKEKGID
jgi:hypothetical protein